jgi:hypothetical protein
MSHKPEPPVHDLANRPTDVGEKLSKNDYLAASHGAMDQVAYSFQQRQELNENLGRGPNDDNKETRNHKIDEAKAFMIKHYPQQLRKVLQQEDKKREPEIGKDGAGREVSKQRFTAEQSGILDSRNDTIGPSLYAIPFNPFGDTNLGVKTNEKAYGPPHPAAQYDPDPHYDLNLPHDLAVPHHKPSSHRDLYHPYGHSHPYDPNLPYNPGLPYDLTALHHDPSFPIDPNLSSDPVSQDLYEFLDYPSYASIPEHPSVQHDPTPPHPPPSQGTLAHQPASPPIRPRTPELTSPTPPNPPDPSLEDYKNYIILELALSADKEDVLRNLLRKKGWPSVWQSFDSIRACEHGRSCEWTGGDDELLVRLRQEADLRFDDIAVYLFIGMRGRQCEQRYNLLING